MKNVCKKCDVAKGIKLFECSGCGNSGDNYSNGLDLCVDCIEKASICCICGDKIDLNFDSLMAKYEENISSHVDKIVKWVKESFSKTGAKGVVLGMSGGIDCSVVARLFNLAEIPVLVVMMPYGNSMDFSDDRRHAKVLIDKFRLNNTTIDITRSVDELRNALDYMSCIDIKNEDSSIISKVNITNEAVINIKPRVRMTTLYALAQSLGYVVAGTGNLSERTMGYFTKWGDGACDINPIGNLTKTQVRIIAKYIGIPDEIINKPPSANLFEGQTDEDELGITYYDMDKYILTGEASKEVKDRIDSLNKSIQHKILPIPIYKGI